jgi:hypothetical protein
MAQEQRRDDRRRPAPLLSLLDSAPLPGNQHKENVDACYAQPSTKIKRKPGRPKGSKNKPKVALTLAEAIAMVKAAGYRVSKPRTSRRPKPKDRVGPTFVATFADGTVTRMSTFTSLENLDWDRGIRLSQAAYQSRWRARARHERGLPLTSLWGPTPPAIISAYFAQDGKVLAQRTNGNAS